MEIDSDIKSRDLSTDAFFIGLANAKLGPAGPPLDDGTIGYLVSMPEFQDLWSRCVDRDVSVTSDDEDTRFERVVKSFTEDPRFGLFLKKSIEATQTDAASQSDHASFFQRLANALKKHAKDSPERFVITSLLMAAIVGVIVNRLAQPNTTELAQSIERLSASLADQNKDDQQFHRDLSEISQQLSQMNKNKVDLSHVQTDLDMLSRSISDQTAAITALRNLQTISSDETKIAKAMNDKGERFRVELDPESLKQLKSINNDVNDSIKGLKANYNTLNSQLNQLPQNFPKFPSPLDIRPPDPLTGLLATTITFEKEDPKTLEVPARNLKSDSPTRCILTLEVIGVHGDSVDLQVSKPESATASTNPGATTKQQAAAPAAGTTASAAPAQQPIQACAELEQPEAIRVTSGAHLLPGAAVWVSLEMTSRKVLFFHTYPVRLTFTGHGEIKNH
jgi:hypothetical protein